MNNAPAPGNKGKVHKRNDNAGLISGKKKCKTAMLDAHMRSCALCKANKESRVGTIHVSRLNKH